MDLKIEAHHYFIGQNQSTIYKIITQSIQDNGKSYKTIMNDITTFIFDVDGVLTQRGICNH
jgi:hypothetical protein